MAKLVKPVLDLKATGGEITGFSVSFLSEPENGKATFEQGKAIRIANLLGLNLELNPR